MHSMITIFFAALTAFVFLVLTGCSGAGSQALGIHSDLNINGVHERMVRATCRRLASVSEYTDTLDTETYGDCMKAAGFSCKRDFETECFYDALNELRCYGEHSDGFRCDRFREAPAKFKECFIEEVKDISLGWSGYIKQASPCFGLK